MAVYQIYVFCDKCYDAHPMPIKINIKNGPDKKQSIKDTYHGEEVPPNIAQIINNEIKCPKTNEMYIQKDNNQIFLVPI